MPVSQTPVRAEIMVPKTDLPPEAANWFHFSLANLDVQMLVGYIDPREAGTYVQGRRSGSRGGPQLTPTISRRVMMSLSGFAHLRTQVHEIERKMREAGIPFVEDTVPTPPNG
jgi:hypothetical protein